MFVIPVPSKAVQQYAEAERARRIDGSVHAQEKEDAPPHVMMFHREEIYHLAPELGIAVDTIPAGGAIPYEPSVYQRFYAALLTHRHRRTLPLDTILPTTTFSVYAYAIAHHRMTPHSDDVARFLTQVETMYPDLDLLEQEVAQWYRV